MNFIILICSAFLDVMQTVLTKMSSQRADMKYMLSFNALKSIGAFLVLLIMAAIGFRINTPTLLYALVYGMLLLSSMCTGFIALNCGNMAITAIVISYSVIIPFLFGSIVLNEPVTLIQISGLVMLLISVLLMNYKKSGESLGKKWVLFTFSCFFTNGLCSVVQKLHQTAYPGQYCEEFMAIAFGVITIILLALLLIKYKGIEKVPTKNSVGSGICVGISYFLLLYLSSVFDATVLFPMNAVCIAVLNCFASRVVFKDRLKRLQLIAVIIGVLSVVMIQN